jgi:hypothetical protein
MHTLCIHFPDPSTSVRNSSPADAVSLLFGRSVESKLTLCGGGEAERLAARQGDLRWVQPAGVSGELRGPLRRSGATSASSL